MHEDNKPEITFTINTPYLISDLLKFQDRHNNPYPVKPVMSICRCGESADKPFCDGSHRENGINGEKQPDRTPYKWRDYFGKEITVHFNAGLCSHDGSCMEAAPGVFNKEKRPWIYPDGAAPEEVIRAIELCPSGALTYTISGEHHIVRYTGETLIKASKKGPIEVCGEIELKDDQNTQPERYDWYVLCGCGQSKNKPFCDGQHLEKLKNEK